MFAENELTKERLIREKVNKIYLKCSGISYQGDYPDNSMISSCSYFLSSEEGIGKCRQPGEKTRMEAHPQKNR